MENKIYLVKNFDLLEICENHNMSKDAYIKGPDDMGVSDGYHTMDELYEHRIQLFITLCKAEYHRTPSGAYPDKVWRSKLHADGTKFEGWFILGIFKEAGKQITYHLPMSRWEDTNFATTKEKAPEWDKHTPADVLERLKHL